MVNVPSPMQMSKRFNKLCILPIDVITAVWHAVAQASRTVPAARVDIF